MKRHTFFGLLGIMLSVTFPASPQGKPAETIRLVYLGGQSNMDGYGYIRDLPDSLNRVFENCWIFHGNPTPDGVPGGGAGIWAPLQPGHGAGFVSDGEVNRYSDRFGVELSLAARLQELYPGEKIALVKYSRGGTSIDSSGAAGYGCWEPDFGGAEGINQYDHFLATVRNALAKDDIDGNGVKDKLVPCGILWMQGESDAAFTEEIASRYHAHLTRLMDLIRAAFLTDDLPVVVGKISDSGLVPGGKVWRHGELVQYAEEKYVLTDARAAIVRETKNYGYSDPYHYNSEGYIDLGRRFAEALVKLENVK
ncbi:MAG TPA: hypothetical protein ENN63_01085 [Bacteroidetes bacterium]|nr:hypothetical protein [Bacteroidota bacterium]